MSIWAGEASSPFSIPVAGHCWKNKYARVMSIFTNWPRPTGLMLSKASSVSKGCYAYQRPFQGGASFVDHLCYFSLVFGLLLGASVYRCLVVTCWERADLLALVCDVWLWSCHFPIGILGQVWFLIVSIPKLCPLSYFYACLYFDQNYTNSYEHFTNC